MAHGGRRPGAGRKPKVITELKRLTLEQAGADAELALGFVVSMLKDNRLDVELRLDCAKEVMDRVWGRSKQRQEITGKDGGPVEFDSEKWKRERQERIEQSIASVAGQAE